MVETRNKAGTIIWENAELANLRGANLWGANLRGADLEGANLEGANLEGADLGGASYGKDIPLTKEPLQILALRWHVLIMDTHMKIGCQLHSFERWDSFSDALIAKMDTDALEFWKAHKDTLMALCKAR